MKTTALGLILLIWCCSLCLAGDYFAYRAKKVTYEFATPFDDESSPKLSDAKVTITTQPEPWEKRLGNNNRTLLGDVSIAIGEHKLSIPKTILKDMDRVSLMTLDFYWVNGIHYFSISSHVEGMNKDIHTREFIITIKDGTLIDYQRGKKSQKDKFPEIFKDAP